MEVTDFHGWLRALCQKRTHSRGPGNEEIWSADVWRLLHLPPIEKDGLSFNFRPCTSWKPCGKIKTRNCALRVTSHLDYIRPQFHYHHWEWVGGRSDCSGRGAFQQLNLQLQWQWVLSTVKYGSLLESRSTKKHRKKSRWTYFVGLLSMAKVFLQGISTRMSWMESIFDEDSDEEDKVSGNDKKISEVLSNEKHGSLQRRLKAVHWTFRIQCFRIPCYLVRLCTRNRRTTQK